MPDFVRVANTSEIPDPGKLIVEVVDRLVVLFHVGGQFYALDDVCTHDGGPLGEGQLDGFCIACPRHGAQFDIRDGRASDDARHPADRGSRSESRRGRYPRAVSRRIINDDKIPHGGGSLRSHRAAPRFPRPDRRSIGYHVLCGFSSHCCKRCHMPVSEESAREALKQVIDPELFVNIVDLGLVYLVTVADADEGKQKVSIEMTMTSPACPAGPQLIQQSKDTLGRLEGVSEVEVKLVMIPPWTPDRMTEDARDQLGIF